MSKASMMILRIFFPSIFSIFIALFRPNLANDKFHFKEHPINQSLLIGKWKFTN
jgi:hypothetical protein